MAEGREILVLRDEAGTPFLVPQAVVEQEELITFPVGEDDYLVPRKTLLESVVPATQPDDAEGLSIRGPDGTRVWLSTDTLEQARVVSAEERAAAEQMLDVEVVAHSQLAFEITPLGRGELGYGGRGSTPGVAFVS